MDLFDNPDAPALEMPLFAARTAAPEPAPSGRACRLRAHLLAGGRALDDRDLLELLLGAAEPALRARELASHLLARFGTAPRAIAAPADRLRSLAGLDDAQVALLKTAEALAVRHARAAVPEIVDPVLNSYDRVVAYCRTLAAHRPAEELHLLHLDTRNRLIRDERHQRGSVNHTPLYPREVCIRALDANASAMIVVHNHPSGSPDPSRADVSMTEKLRDALKLIEVTLHDHLIVTASDVFSFRAKGLL